MKYIILLLLLLPFSIALDSELTDVCGGDSELVIHCIGDEELNNIHTLDSDSSAVGGGDSSPKFSLSFIIICLLIILAVILAIVISVKMNDR